MKHIKCIKELSDHSTGINSWCLTDLYDVQVIKFHKGLICDLNYGKCKGI